MSLAQQTSGMLQFDSILWVWSSFDCYLGDNFGNEPDAWSFVAGVARPPCTRGGVQRRMWRGPRALRSLKLGVFTPLDGFALLQQHCGEGSCMAVAFLVWWCLPLSTLDRAGDLMSARVRNVGGPVVCVFLLQCRHHV
jgi:hypothetical protein